MNLFLSAPNWKEKMAKKTCWLGEKSSSKNEVTGLTMNCLSVEN